VKEIMQKKFTYTETLCDGEYKFIQVLGKGSKSLVCLYSEIEIGELWTVKFDPIGQIDSTLLTESTFLKNNSAGMDRMPKYKDHGKLDGRRYLIMEYLEYSIKEFIELKNKEGACSY
jgi:serine/threonine protein kinase